MEPNDEGGLTARGKLERQTDLVNMMVHDLKGPLMVVMSNLDLVIKSAGILEDDKECAETARTGCDGLLRTINEMLDIGKMEAGMLKPETERLDLAELAEKEVDKISLPASDRDIKTSFDHEGPLFVLGDGKLIGRVMANLLSNGLKFSPSGSTLRVSLARGAKTARFTVSDEGPGVPAGYRKVIFDKYVQAGLWTRRIHGGTGLGLAFCKLAIEAQNGRIGINDAAAGSEFYFEVLLDGRS